MKEKEINSLIKHCSVRGIVNFSWNGLKWQCGDGVGMSKDGDTPIEALIKHSQQLEAMYPKS